MYMKFKELTRVANARTTLENERKEFLSLARENKKRDRKGQCKQSTSQATTLAPQLNRKVQTSQILGSQARTWQAKSPNQNPVQNQIQGYVEPTKAQVSNQQTNPCQAIYPLCNTCGKRHQGVCRQGSGA